MMIKDNVKRAIASCVMTNSLEWFGLALYGFFSSIIGPQFFKSDNPLIANILALSVFSLGIVSRPIGAIIFGIIGDKIGRKRALYLTLYLVAIPTTIMGILPTYEHLGVSAGIILMLLFVCQGLGVGGGFAGSLVVLYENSESHANRRSFICSWGPFSLLLGFFLAAITGVLISKSMSHEALYAWGWRIPFFIGLSGNLIGKYINKKLTETAEKPKEDSQTPAEKKIFSNFFKHNTSKVLMVIWIDILVGTGCFFLTVFVPSYFISILKFDTPTVHAVSVISLFFGCFCIVLGGILADKFTKEKVMIISALSLFAVSLPVFALFQQRTFLSMTVGYVVLLFFFGIYFGQISPMISSIFDKKIRFLGVSLSHNMAMALFGAPAPLISTYLLAATGNPLSPAIVLMVVSLISVCGVVYYKKNYNTNA